ncbi:MAG: hypothetical protein IMZ53_01490 [Thermoplasmata archaeon]|nr:hypothetical protein [Thermoplasmata archaeon]
MGTRYLSVYIDTAKTHDQLTYDAAQIFRSLGGPIYKTPTGFQVVNGKVGVSMSFVANLTANVVVQKLKENKYEIQVFLHWTWGAFIWIAVIMGILTGGISLLAVLLYLFFDPSPVYQQMLFRVVGFEST